MARKRNGALHEDIVMKSGVRHHRSSLKNQGFRSASGMVARSLTEDGMQRAGSDVPVDWNCKRLPLACGKNTPQFGMAATDADHLESKAGQRAKDLAR
jgi:hypothetical protein